MSNQPMCHSAKEMGRGRDAWWRCAVARRIGAAMVLVALVLSGGGCVSYSGCRTQDDRVRARYEQHFIVPGDSSSTIFWKNTKHVFFDIVTCCFHEIWRGHARRTYRSLILAEQCRAQEEAEARKQEAERLARLQREQEKRAQAERERLERMRRQEEAEKALAKQREENQRKCAEELRKREEEKRVRDRDLMRRAMLEPQQGVSSDAVIRQLKNAERR